MFEGKPCKGVKIEVTDRAAVRALDLFVNASYLLKKHNGADFAFKPEEIRKMTGSADFYTLWSAGAKPALIIAAFKKNNAAWRAETAKFLLYK